jgi:hypothetical protein
VHVVTLACPCSPLLVLAVPWDALPDTSDEINQLHAIDRSASSSDSRPLAQKHTEQGRSRAARHCGKSTNRRGSHRSVELIARISAHADLESVIDVPMTLCQAPA